MKKDPTQPSKGRPERPAASEARRLWHPLLLKSGKSSTSIALDVVIKLHNLRHR